MTVGGRNAASRRVPRLLALLAVASLAALFAGQARSSAGGGVLPPFRYTSASPYYDQAYQSLSLRCRQYVAPGHVTVVCVLRKTTPKA